jgi:mannose-6-phosphate isomerase-like protein (cupin superfamily)
VNTPWGTWEVLLENPRYKVKRIVVNPGQRLSYQVHSKRSEHWMVVEGRASVTLKGETRQLETGQTVDIPVGMPHRIANEEGSPLAFIEIQTGSYFGEDDIVRLEDDYDRTTKR